MRDEMGKPLPTQIHHQMSTKKKTSTGLERQHAYRSFKERVDLLKIEPARNLAVRASDFVETSHLLVTLEHWKEVNVSGNFTDFLYEVEKLCQTLPQILHHQNAIYSALEKHIRVLDINSLQPLLEILAQFIHDLGPDFMAFYEQFLLLVIDVSQKTNPNDSQNIRNTSNVLEWTFNTLAYAFKYLARTLVLDLGPTFEQLLPVFEMTKKTYVARFCAEALSFLVKKLKQQPLEDLVHRAFNDHKQLLQENHSYREAMIVLFSEAMKNTQNTFHSKSATVFAVLLENAMAAGRDNDSCIDALCDIMLNIIDHGSAEACVKFYTSALNHLISVVADNTSLKRLGYVCQVLLSLCFAESGNKVQDWDVIFGVVLAITANFDALYDENDPASAAVLASITSLFATIVRNCNIKYLTRHFSGMAEYLMAKEEGLFFVSFYELLMINAKEKVAGFGATQMLQAVINKASSDKILSRLALCLTKVEQQNPNIKTDITLPHYLSAQLLEAVAKDSQTLVNDNDLLALHWKLCLLMFSSELKDNDSILLTLLTKLSASKPSVPAFVHDVIGITLVAAVRGLKHDETAIKFMDLFEVFTENLESSRQSTLFLSGATILLDEVPQLAKDTLRERKSAVISSLTKSLSLPDIKVRRAAAELMRKYLVAINEKVPYVVAQAGIIDNVPLTVENSNDVKMRIRLMLNDYSNQTGLTNSDHLQMANYIVGLLSNGYQPCWQAVNESIQKLAATNVLDELWARFHALLRTDFAAQSNSYWTGDVPFGSDGDVFVGQFQSSHERFAKYFDMLSTTFVLSENDILHDLYEQIIESSTTVQYNALIRNRVIQALSAIPSVAERNGAALIDLVIELQDDDHQGWMFKDINALCSIFPKFKRIAKVSNNQELFAAMTKQVSSKDAATQKASLEVLFAWNRPEINKYKDNLLNLLEDKLFRDELQTLVSKSSESKIEDSDREAVVPVVLRLLYGRAKGVTNNNSKNGRKFAIASVLPNLPDEYIRQFLLITAENFDFAEYFDTELLPQATQKDLRAMVGYLNMLYEVYVGLGYKFAHVLTYTIQPLLFTLVNAQSVLEQSTEDEITIKTAKTIRQLGFKCLNHLFKVTSKTYNWKDEAPLIYERVIKPRLTHFESENAQQPSSMMQMMLSWISSPELVSLYYFDDYAPVNAIVALLSNPIAKDTVRSALLDFCIACFTQKDVHDDQFYSVLALLVDGLLNVLPSIIQNSEDKDINLRASTLLLLIIEGKYVEAHSTKGELIKSCSRALEKPAIQIGINDKVSILLSLASVVEDYDSSMEELSGLYETCSRSLRIYKDRNMRSALVKVFEVFGRKFEDLAVVSELLASLNAFSERRMLEPDYDRRMQAYRKLNEELYSKLNVLQWTPIIYSNLFFINDPEEISIRSNAAHTLTRYIDCMNSKTEESAAEFVSFWHSVIVSYLRAGLKKDAEEIRDGYINILAHATRKNKHLTELQSMKALLSDDTEEDFFVNFNHVQLGQRQKALKILEANKNQISPECMYHYLLPMTEVYTVCQNERYLNLWNDVNDAWQQLTLILNYKDFRQLFRKHITAAARVSDNENELRDRCRLVVSISRGLKTSFDQIRLGAETDHFHAVPDDIEVVHKQIMDDFLAPIMKLVNIRNDDTIVQRAPLVEAAVNCLLCVSDSVAEASIAGVLTSTCQALRSRTQHIRDAIRKALGKVARILGPKYFRYIVKELKTALSRGSQIHTLSYTLHSILVAVKGEFSTGDLDESALLIVDIIMEDIFGAAGQEKDAEGYVSKMIEVKSKKSFDSAEILTSNINFNRFRAIIDPFKMLMRENLPLKTKKNLDELIKRYATGLNFNLNASKMDVLVLCYELHQQSTSVEEPVKRMRNNKRGSNDDHFLVNLNAKPVRMVNDNSQIMFTLQTLAYELMRTALGKNRNLMTVGNLEGFFPLMSQTLELDNESVLCSLLRVLNLIITLPFAEERDEFFEKAALKAFKIIQDLPTTSPVVSQLSLRYLASIIRHKPTIELNHSSLTYLLTRIIPDLEEPHRQGLAFNFLKAVVLQHIMLPEVYDVMDKVSNIMVLNHTGEIRAMSRSLYFQFLMEYEQGEQKLEKAFKFLVNNLSYPTEDGRLSVMEFMHSFVLKSSASLLDQLSVSFFVGLSNVLVTDDVRKCREMASELLAFLFRRSANSATLQSMEKLCLAWLNNTSNPLLQRCGLMVYKVYLSEFELGKSTEMDKRALAVIVDVFKRAKNDKGEHTDGSASWEEVYTCMNVWAVLCKEQKDEILSAKYESVWLDLFETLLFPHTWVRLLSARLVGTVLSNLADVEFEITPQQLQTITYRLLRQLAAPTVSADLGTQVVKNMIQIITKWEQDGTKYIQTTKAESADSEEAPKFELATDFAIDRFCKIMRQERSSLSSNLSSSSAVTASIQLAAMVSQILTPERLKAVAPKIILGLYMIVENKAYTAEENELLELGNECLKILEAKLGTTGYMEAYTEVKIQVTQRREQRRADKAQLAIKAPEAAARRKIKKNERLREKRKHPRDENGYFKPKRRNPIR